MMHGYEKSDPAIVAMKPANKAGQLTAEQSAAEPTAAEPVEPRAGTKGNADQQARAGRRVGKACHRRWNAYGKARRKGRRRSSPRSSTISASNCSNSRSSNLRRTLHPVWIG